MPLMRQLADEELRGSFEPAATLSASARTALEHEGVTFAEETEFDEPGPTQWAAVELDNGRQYLLVHHYEHADSFVELRAPVGDRSPAEVASHFVRALKLRRDEVTWVAESWPRPPGA
jgi:hypothetical protein